MQRWVVGAAVAAAVVLVAGWFLVVAPERDHAAQLREQAALQDISNAQLQTAVEVLRVKAAKLPEKRAELDDVLRRIPERPALPDLLRTLSSTASSAGVELLLVTPAPPAGLEPAVPAAAPAPADPAAAQASAAPADPAPAAPVPAAAGVSTIEVKLAVVGDFYAVEHFVALLEELPRALRLTSLSLDPGIDALADDEVAAARAAEEGRSVRATLTARVFTAAPDSAAPAPAAAAPAAPAPAAPAPAAAAPGAPSATQVAAAVQPPVLASQERAP